MSYRYPDSTSRCCQNMNRHSATVVNDTTHLHSSIKIQLSSQIKTYQVPLLAKLFCAHSLKQTWLHVPSQLNKNPTDQLSYQNIFSFISGKLFHVHSLKQTWLHGHGFIDYSNGGCGIPSCSTWSHRIRFLLNFKFVDGTNGILFKLWVAVMLSYRWACATKP